MNNHDSDKKITKKFNSVSFKTLFRYASKKDYFLMFLGAIGAAVDGAAMPFVALLMGDVADSFGPTNTGDDIVRAAGTIAWQFAVVGVVSFITSYIGFACWM